MQVIFLNLRLYRHKQIENTLKGKSNFSRSEADEIISLIRKKLKASTDEQKKVRDKIRKIGFYASDFGIGGGYTEKDFLRVVKITGESNSHVITPTKSVTSKPASTKNKRSDSDESYIIDLCDEVLNMKSSRQNRFDFLKGDAGTSLPVDAYYESLKLVIEYRERQHTEDVKFFNRRQTVSGVNRGEQRKIYDQKRRDVLPKNGIKMIEFGYAEFEHTKAKRLIRNREKDIRIIKKKLND